MQCTISSTGRECALATAKKAVNGGGAKESTAPSDPAKRSRTSSIEKYHRLVKKATEPRAQSRRSYTSTRRRTRSRHVQTHHQCQGIGGHSIRTCLHFRERERGAGCCSVYTSTAVLVRSTVPGSILRILVSRIMMRTFKRMLVQYNGCPIATLASRSRIIIRRRLSKPMMIVMMSVDSPCLYTRV